MLVLPMILANNWKKVQSNCYQGNIFSPKKRGKNTWLYSNYSMVHTLTSDEFQSCVTQTTGQISPPLVVSLRHTLPRPEFDDYFDLNPNAKLFPFETRPGSLCPSSCLVVSGRRMPDPASGLVWNMALLCSLYYIFNFHMHESSLARPQLQGPGTA